MLAPAATGGGRYGGRLPRGAAATGGGCYDGRPLRWGGAGRKVGCGLKWSQLVTRAGLVTRWDGSVDPEITSVVEDSRQAGLGSCFVAVRGTRADGHGFVEAACQAGAAAVVCERPVKAIPGVAVLQLASARGVVGRLAAVLYGLDERLRSGRLNVVGVTGTNGKSTFCYLMQAILRQAGYPTAMLGTVQYDLVSRTIESGWTTPPAATLMGYLAEAAEAGATHAVMEVSSHALDQGRCDGVRFAVGVFSNLTGDHLDYHETMESYLRAKKRLFDGLDANAVAVVNAEDPAGRRIVADCQASVLWYGIASGDDAVGGRSAERDVEARIERIAATGSRFELTSRWAVGRGHSASPVSRWIDSALVGRHNVQNCLAAASAALGLGIGLDTIAAGLDSVRCVPGRLQRVEGTGRACTVLVDYAHTDDALENVLSAVRPLATRRLIVMFGCGGDRDKSKRPRMAAVVAKYADRIVVTSDNPRTEEPEAIIADILPGFDAAAMRRVTVESDRRAAIGQAIAMAEADDVVVLAGKGHETYQEIGRQRVPFDDVVVAGERLKVTGERGG